MTSTTTIPLQSSATTNGDTPTPSTSTPVHVPFHTHTPVPATTVKANGDSIPNLGELDAKCGGCLKVIDQDSGGVVVAFGNSLWHVDCFRCAKCHERVSADTNLLLLSDGNPVCGNCSYQCFICKQAITEEAIMTGDESYHAHCFTCRTCKRRIDELVFAKTSQGIYCMACHNERVARSRRHAEAKRQRAARKEKEREREREKENRDTDEGSVPPLPLYKHDDGLSLVTPVLPPAATFGSPAANGVPNITSRSPYASPSATPQSNSSDRLGDIPSFPESTPEPPRSRELSVDRPIPRAASPVGRIAQNMPLPASPSDGPLGGRVDGLDRSPQPPSRGTPVLGSSQSLGAPNGSPSLNASPSRGSNIGLGVGPVGLGIPTSKAERRRSINPAMTFNLDAQNSTFAVEPRVSPLPHSPLRASFTDGPLQMPQPLRSPTSPTPNHLGAEAFPFISGGSSGQRAVPGVSTDTPPIRISSLPESPDEDMPPIDVGNTAPLSLTPRMTSNDRLVDSLGESGNQTSTPRLNAPNLPPMSFSLSDPDFALILNNIDRSPQKANAPTPVAAQSGAGNGDVGRTIRQPLIDGHNSSNSSPPSPNTTQPLTNLQQTRRPSVQPDDIPQPPQPEFILTGQSTSTSSLPTLDSRSPSRIRLSPHDSMSAPRLLRSRQPSAESTTSITSRLGPDSAFGAIVELVAGAKFSGGDKVEVELGVLVGVVGEVEDLKEALEGLKSKYTGIKRTSQQYSEGLTVAGEEYDKELAHRQELEAEVIRLRAQVHSQTARLSVISGDERRQETLRRRSHDLANNVTGLERDVSRLRAMRDMTLAEVEELENSRNGSEHEDAPGDRLSKNLTNRLDTIKEQYREELEPLTAQREALQREINELQHSREQLLEESTALSAKNEELAELNAQLSRQAEIIQDTISRVRPPTIFSSSSSKSRSHPSGSPSMSSLATSTTLQEVPEETARVVKVTKPEPIEAAPARRFKWYKSSKGPADMAAGGGGASMAGASISRPLALPAERAIGIGLGMRGMQRPSTEFGLRDHSFTQHSSMRFTKCELCGEKMWGLQEVRCAACGVVCHAKCSEKLPRSCAGTRNGTTVEVVDENLPPSMFGRELAEQVVADKAGVPVIVTKCISAVEAVGMEYEGIYRKTGGSGQIKQITQLFERGDYDSFDLADLETFNDVSSVTSVLKTYFRQLPNPLLTHKLHESFVAAASIRDTGNKHSALCALLKELPREHYETLKALMMHLNRVTGKSSVNLMTSQNIGVVFGPTLMRSSDPNREFGDMAGKALSVQWMVDHAPQVFVERVEG